VPPGGILAGSCIGAERAMPDPAIEPVCTDTAGDALAAEFEAYNFAFCQLELAWRWDAQIFHQLHRIAVDSDLVGAYIERSQSHLLRVYEKNFLRDLVLSTKARYRQDPPRSTR
jgi:hypothetical protein